MDEPAYKGGEPIFKSVVPITKPTLPDSEKVLEKYSEIVKSGMITNFKTNQEFEKGIKEYTGVKNAICLNSCTSGLMLLLRSHGLKGDCIVPSFTFCATAHAAVWAGLKPVFVDCKRDTFNIDPELVEKNITENTSAIIATNIFGNPCNIEALEKIAEKHRVKLFFDSAHGLGSKYKGKCLGRFGDGESFSLSPTKLITAGEGGIVMTQDDKTARNIKIGRNYGDPGNYDCEFVGLSARMSEFNALMGVETLKDLEKNVEKRNMLAKRYKERLSKLPGLSFQKISPDDRSSFKDFSILVDAKEFGISRDKLQEYLDAENIKTKKYFYPAVHNQQAYAEYKEKYDSKLPNTNYIADHALSLPLFSHMDPELVDKVCSAIERIRESSI